MSKVQIRKNKAKNKQKKKNKPKKCIVYILSEETHKVGTCSENREKDGDVILGPDLHKLSALTDGQQRHCRGHSVLHCSIV